MKIVHVVESLEIGGLETMVLALADLQRKEGHAVEIICLWRRGPLADQAEQRGIAVHCCDKHNGADFGALGRLRARLRQSKADVVHTHNAMAHYYAVAAGLGLKPARTISTRHSMGRDVPGSRQENLYRMALRRTDAVVSVCGAVSKRFVEHRVVPPAKALVVPNGINLSGFIPHHEESARSLRAELNVGPHTVIFGNVGRLHPAKNQIGLLRAMRKVADAGHDAVLMIVGDGALRQELENGVRELALQPHVRMLGARQDVPRLLAGMDVFVLPSRTEGYSIALLEAAASALPAITTDVGGNAEIVNHGHTGLVVPPGDEAALVQAMVTLLTDAELRRRMGQQAREWVQQEGTLDTMAARYLAVYQGRGSGRVGARVAA